METRRTRRPRTRRGRPHKFGEPSRLIALTLPQSVIRGLRQIDPDLARAVVRLFRSGTGGPETAAEPAQEAELVSVGTRRALIAVNRRAIPELPGVAMIPFSETRAFLALSPGTTLADLELAIVDYLDEFRPADATRRTLTTLRERLRHWRRDPALRFETRSILVAETVPARTTKR
ncbi:MAG: hypothetical protein KGN76_09335 [Acidobacteriota bacterium]|nr:hypothetical protein [Acidobacteriota bacterium]